MDFDVIVVGGGHNGIIASVTLARHGLKVLVVEKTNILGGLAGGYSSGRLLSRFAYAIGLLPPELASWLNLFGPRDLVYSDPSWVELDENGEINIRWWQDRIKLAEEFRNRNAGDINALLALIDRFWYCYKKQGLYYTPSAPSREEAASRLDDCDPETALIVEKSVANILSDYISMDYWDLLIYPSMYGSNGFALAYYLQNAGIWGQPRGGMAILSERLRELAAKNSVDLLVGEPVKSFIFENGVVKGVITKSGFRLESKVVLFSAPITSLLDIEGSDRLEETEIRSLEDIRGLEFPITRIDYYVSRQPLPPSEVDWRGIPIYVYWTGKGGGEYSYPTLLSGRILGLHMIQASGYIVDPYDPLPPGIREEDIVEISMRTLKDQIECCSNYTGHPDHVPLVEPYMFDSRPLPGWGDYRTSLPGLYHGSASSYPGGEINGVAGFNAALRILIDLGIKPEIDFLQSLSLK